MLTPINEARTSLSVSRPFRIRGSVRSVVPSVSCPYVEKSCHPCWAPPSPERAETMPGFTQPRTGGNHAGLHKAPKGRKLYRRG